MLTSPGEGNQALLISLRRIGWIMLGDQHIADNVLQHALMAAPAGASADNPKFAHKIMQFAFEAYDGIANGRGGLVVFNGPRKGDGPIISGLYALTHMERAAVALLVVERLSVLDAAFVSGRPEQLLEQALTSALDQLTTTINDD